MAHLAAAAGLAALACADDTDPASSDDTTDAGPIDTGSDTAGVGPGTESLDTTQGMNTGMNTGMGTGMDTGMGTGMDTGMDTGTTAAGPDLFCFDDFGPQLSIFTLTDGPPTVETVNSGSYIPIAVATSSQWPLILGAIPENGDDSGIFFYDNLADVGTDAPPDVFIALPGPNQFDDGCAVPDAVLLTSDTVDSVVCDGVAAACTVVETPRPLGACECAGMTCIASSSEPGLLESLDGGLSFVEQGNDYRASQIAGNGQGAMYLYDFFNGVGRLTTDAGATYVDATAPRGAEDIEALLVDDEFAVGARPFRPELVYVAPLSDAAFEPFAIATGLTIVQGFELRDGLYLFRTDSGVFYRTSGLTSGRIEEIRVTQDFAAHCTGVLALQGE